MKRLDTILAAGLAAGLALPVIAHGQPRPRPPRPPISDITITAQPGVVVFGTATGVAGQLKGSGKAGQIVTLEADDVPFTGFGTVSTTTSDPSGHYAFSVRPLLNTKYRVTTKSSPPAASAEVLVYTRMKVSLRVSDALPSRGQSVRFFGSVTPAHDGSTVHIQQRTSTGAFRNVARVPLTDNGTGSSRYGGRLRIYRNGVYRVLAPSHADHAKGISALRTIRVG
jgi:hypothetical protein